jgi:pimeloyl-ACP methyl ester carboxylesterase
MGRRLWRRVRRVWITLGIAVTIGFVGWSLVAYRASAEGRAAIRSDISVTVQDDDGIRSFMPRRSPTAESPALVFFPGALVDPVAYAPLARAAAFAGFPAYIVALPRRGALGGADDPALERRLDRLLTAPSGPRHWVIAGHSRGAVVASRIAAERRTGVVGLVLIGSSHPRDVDLSGLPVSVTKIVGTRDGLASRTEVEANRTKLPAATRWVWIDGGNHSQFGWYGFQPGDRRATIAPGEQRATMIRAVIDALVRAAEAADYDRSVRKDVESTISAEVQGVSAR